MSTFIKQIVTVPTEGNEHGNGRAFILLKDGTLYITETEVGHQDILDYLLEYELDIDDDDFYDKWYPENLQAHGRIGLYSYALYFTPDLETYREQLGLEIESQFGASEETTLMHVAADEWKFIHVPGGPEQTWEDNWLSLIIDLENNIVYYSDENRFHAPVLEGIANLPGNAQHSMDLHDEIYEDFVGGAYMIDTGNTNIFDGEDYPELKARITEYFNNMYQRTATSALKFEYVPDDGQIPWGNASGEFPNRIPWIYWQKTNTVYYTDQGGYHLPIMIALDLADEDHEHSDDIRTATIWAGVWNTHLNKNLIFGFSNFSPEQMDEMNTFFSSLEAEDHPVPEIGPSWTSNVKVVHKENPWHIFRKPFSWNENNNTVTIGEEGTGYLYKNSFTLDSLVSREVRKVLAEQLQLFDTPPVTPNPREVVEVDSEIDGYPWNNERRPFFYFDGVLYLGTPGGHHAELLEEIYDNYEDYAISGFKTEDEFAGKGGYNEPEGGFYTFTNASNDPLYIEMIALIKRNFPGTPIYAFGAGLPERVADSDARNQAEDYWYRDDLYDATEEDIEYDEQWQWWTSWIWDIDHQRLLIKNQEEVNHAELLNYDNNFTAAIYGIISQRYKGDGQRIFAVVPYYSDMAQWDEDVPEYVDEREEVNKAIEAVKKWHNHLRPDTPLQVHESATEIKPLEPEEKFYNWQGEHYHFEPTHLGEHREGVNAYDGADLIGSITWTDEGDFVYLRSAYIDPAYRGEGLFKELFEYAPPKPVDGDWADDSPLANFFEKWNQRWSKTSAVDESMIESLVHLLMGSQGDTESLKQLLIPNNTRYAPEEIEEAIDQAYEIYLVRKAEEDKAREEATRLWDEQAARRDWEAEGRQEIRWGINRITGEYWLVKPGHREGSSIHPTMLEAWMTGVSDEDWYSEWEKMAEDFLFGYSEYLPNIDTVEHGSDDSYDLYTGIEPNEDEYQKLGELIKEFMKSDRGEWRVKV